MKKAINIFALSAILVVVGCAKKEEAMNTEMAADAVASSVDLEQNTVAEVSESPVQQVENPEQLLTLEQSVLEKNRQLVKTSQIDFEVADLQETTLAIEKQLLNVNGYIEVKQINYQVQNQEARNKLDGTIDIFEKVQPLAELTIRVPNQNVTTFLNRLIPLIKNFNQQSYEAKRYELKLLEEKINTAQQVQGESRALSSQLQKLTQQEVQDRLQYSTISLSYYQSPQLRQSQDINLNRIANIHSDPFLIRIWASVKTGFIAFREAIVWLVMLWPLYIVLLLGYYGYRKLKKNTLQQNTMKKDAE